MSEEKSIQLTREQLQQITELLAHGTTPGSDRKAPLDREVDLWELLRTLWRKAWVMALAAVLGASLFLGGTLLFIPKRYTASALLYVNSSTISMGSTKVSISASELSAAQSLVDTYIVILKTRTTLNEVIEQSGVPYTYEEIIKSDMIHAAAVNSTEVFSIEVTSKDPKEAEKLANTICAVLPNKIASIVEGSSARIVDYAVEPAEKSSPSLGKNTILGGLLGGVLAFLGIALAFLTDTKIQDVDYLKQSYDLPVLAVIPDLTAKDGKNYSQYAKPSQRKAKVPTPQNREGASAERRVFFGQDLNFASAEAYKLLRTNLGFVLPEEDRCRTIAVTSSIAGEGKSTTSINLAYTLAQTNSKVLLVEADLRLPTIGKLLNLKKRPGLSNLLAGQCNGTDVLQRTDLHEGLWVLTAGSIPPNPSELIGSKRMATTLKALESVFDVIILDLPPVNVVTDALLLGGNIDGMIHVVRQGYCHKAALEEACAQHKLARTHLLGFVMTDADTQSKSYSQKQYGESGR